MRALRVATAAFGAVVALSCIVGFAPRSDAAAGSDPAATPTAEATLTATAIAIATPTADATPSSEPTSPPSPSPEPASSPPPPTTNDYHAIPTITVDGFTPAGGKATFTATGGADHGTAALHFQGRSAATQSCSWTSGSTCQPYHSLSAGTWRLDAIQSWSGTPYVSSPRSLYFVVPATPTLVVGDDDGFTISGTGAHDGDLIHVSLTDGTAVCDATVRDGSWSCGDVVAPVAAGSYGYRAVEQDVGSCASHTGTCDCGRYLSGGLSAFSAVAEFVVAPVAPTPTPTPTPTSSPIATPTPAPTPTAPSTPRTATQLTTLATWSFDVAGVNLAHVHPGDHFVVTGSELPPGSIVAGELHSKVVSLGTVVVGSDGTFSLPVTVPSDFTVGPHELVMSLTVPGLEPLVSQQPVIVEPTSSEPSSGSVEPSPDPDATEGSTGGLDTHDPNIIDAVNTNILTHGLNNIADVVTHPQKIPAALEIGLVLLIFAILPAHLLNATLAEQYEKFRTRVPLGRRRTPLWWERLRSATTRAPFLAGLGLTTVTALLFGFADPRFGFTLASLRLFLGLAIALAVVTYLVNVVVGRVMRTRWDVDVEISIRPLGLVLTLVGVVISRLLDFSPGFLVGLVLGLVIAEKAVKAHAWRAVLLRSSILLGLALIAWLAFSLFDSREEGGTFASELAVETLVAITTEAVVGLMVELLPLKLLEGEKLFQKSKVIWGGLYLLAVFIFVVAVVPWEGNWEELGNSLWAWIGIVVGFGVIATGVYLFFRIRRSREPERHEDDELVPVGSETPIEFDGHE